MTFDDITTGAKAYSVGAKIEASPTPIIHKVSSLPHPEFNFNQVGKTMEQTFLATIKTLPIPHVDPRILLIFVALLAIVFIYFLWFNFLR